MAAKKQKTRQRDRGVARAPDRTCDDSRATQVGEERRLHKPPMPYCTSSGRSRSKLFHQMPPPYSLRHSKRRMLCIKETQRWSIISRNLILNSYVLLMSVSLGLTSIETSATPTKQTTLEPAITKATSNTNSVIQNNGLDENHSQQNIRAFWLEFGQPLSERGGVEAGAEEVTRRSHDRRGRAIEGDHQADNQSANQSNSFLSKVSGVGYSRSATTTSEAEAVGLNGSDTTSSAAWSPPSSNPNKCNLSELWRPELCAKEAVTVETEAIWPPERQASHGNEASEVGYQAGGGSGNEKQEHELEQQFSTSFRPLERFRRRAAKEFRAEQQQQESKVIQIPGATNDDERRDGPSLVDPPASYQALMNGANGFSLVSEGELAAEEFADIDPSSLNGARSSYIGGRKQSNSPGVSFENNNWPDLPSPVVSRRRRGRRHRQLTTDSPMSLAGQHLRKRKPTAQTDCVEGSDGDQIVCYHNLIELIDDDLFLVEGSSRLPSSSTTIARRRPLQQVSATAAAESARVRRTGSSYPGVQTIYFGGFFPWLTDDEQVANRGGDHRRLLSAAAAATKPLSTQTSSSTSMINANQQNNDQPQQQQQNDRDIRRKQRTRQENYRGNQHEPSNNNQQKQQHSYENVTIPFTSSASTSSASYTYEGRHQLGKFILPAVRLALDHINTNSSVLDSYKLEIVPRDTQCNATISLKEFFDMVYEEPKKMLLYGDACRVSTDPIAKASYFFDLIQISYADTDPIYTIENYPNFFRVVPSENALSLARIPFIRHFNWTRVGTIYQNLPRYSLPHSKLLTDLERFNIVIKQSVSLPGSVDALQNRDLGDELRKLKERDVRIILGNFDEEWGLLLFCEAFREKMTGRKYQWILTGMSEDKLWQYYKAKGSSCTEQELLIAMDGYIVTDITPVTRSQHPTISGMMAHEYSNEYKRRALDMNISIEENKFYGYVYDGIWAIALALHRVDQQLKYYSQLAEAGRVQLKSEMEGLTSLLDFDYHKPVWVKLIRAALNRTKFNGVTGTVSFYKNERPGLISFSQFQAFRDMSEVIIGSYDALNDILDLKVGFPIFWRGSSPPIDYTIERVTPFRINRTLFVIISILALFGIVLAFVFLTINIKFRDQRYIKMSSPYLNNLIIIGCILTYTSVIILGLDSGLTSEYNFPYICNARAWVLMAGFTLAFGSMFSKTFRVHSIFTNIKLHKKVIKDYKLFMVVFILLTFDVCILIVWQYFDPFYRDTNNGTSIQDSDNEDVIIVPEMEHCQSKRMTIFLSVIYVYKGLLMAFGCFLAWETRHVSIPALNDSKYIGLSVYNVVIMCVIGAGLSFVLRDQQDASFVIISIFIIFCSTTTLCLVFVPKLIELKQNPRAGDHRVRATLKTFKKNYHEEAVVAAGCRDIHGNLIGRGYGANLNDRIKVLLEENVKQRTVLKEKTYELEALTYKYRKIQSMVQSGQYHQAVNSTLAAAAAAGNSTNLVPIPASSSINSSAMQTTVMLIAEDHDSYLGSKGDKLNVGSHSNKLGLNKSPLMSSTTQLTTTNTTSSFNNATDLTTDYSSTKLTSTTTTTNGCSDIQPGKRILVAFDRPPSGKKSVFEQPTGDLFNNDDENNNLEGYPQRLIKANQEADQIVSAIDTTNSQVAHVCQSKQASSKYTNNNNSSAYCSKGATTGNCELVDGGGTTRSKPSQDDLNLFTVFSYISNNNGVEPTANRRRCKRQARVELAENNFNRWSEGPFCTLMVRNNDQRSIARNLESINQGGLIAPGQAILKNSATADHQRASHRQAEMTATGRQQREETRASCPDLVASITTKNDGRPAVVEHRQIRVSVQPPKRQLSQPASDPTAKSRISMQLARERRLPRTISMIEYLGLDEFDLIARRHDKLLRRSRLNNGTKKPPPCCYELNLCPCCSSGGGLPADGRAQSRQAAAAYNVRSSVQSDGDLAISSSEPLNSGDLVQTSSRLSCSTCCSLASRSYASQSELYDDTTHSSRTVSSETVTSSASESLAHNKYLSNSQLSSRSGSILEQDTARAAHYCHHRTQIYDGSRLRNPHHYHHHHHNQPLSSTSSSSSSSSPFIVNNQTKLLQTNESSLCTSGVLYCSPGSKEDANGAAQIVHPSQTMDATTSGGDANSMSVEDNSNAGSSDQQDNEFLSIRCDILESL